MGRIERQRKIRKIRMEETISEWRQRGRTNGTKEGRWSQTGRKEAEKGGKL